MERPRSGTERTPCCRRAHRPQRADHATSRIGHETAPNRLSRLLPHRGFHLGAEGLSRDCGRDAHYWAPPAQNRTCSFPAYGSHLGCLTAGLAAVRTRSGSCDTLSRPCVRHVRHRFAFSLASALCSTASAAGRPALFGGFVATMAESDFSCPCIIGFGSSPSRCGPVGSAACGRT
jgi:hypothetical protein